MARRAVGTSALGVTSIVPAESAEAVAARVRDARATGTTLRIVGAGRWLDAGRPCRAMSELSLAELRGVTEFERGDFTLTARAGTPLGEIDAIAAREGQWLALQPFGSAEGTIGATVATASWGPLASAYGTPRDHLLGCEVVTGVGEVVRAGGRVVKNVAGFDLVRLMTGAWGTLGAITEVTVRLRARPEVDQTLAVPLVGSADAFCATAWRWLRASPFTPLAAELCSATLASRLGVGLESGAVLLVRLGGNEPFVRAAERSVAELGAPLEVDTGIWDRLRDAEPATAMVVRLGALPTELGSLWTAAARAVERGGGWLHATLERGVLRCVLPISRDDSSPEAIERGRGIMDELRATGSRIVERMPTPLWSGIEAPAADPLSSAVRRTFDPDGVLNPGILAPLT